MEIAIGLLVVMFVAYCFQVWTQDDEIAVSAARAAGDSARRTDLPSGCSGLFFVLMLLACVAAMVALALVGG